MRLKQALHARVPEYGREPLLRRRFLLSVRFFFHLHNDVYTIDEEGTELPDERAAIDQAEKIVRIMAAESVREGHLNLSHFLETTDESGKCVSRLTFGEVVAVTP